MQPLLERPRRYSPRPPESASHTSCLSATTAAVACDGGRPPPNKTLESNPIKLVALADMTADNNGTPEAAAEMILEALK